jgi:hypothetical protein
MLLCTGLIAVSCGIFFFSRARFQLRQGAGLVAISLVLLGLFFLLFALFGL